MIGQRVYINSGHQRGRFGRIVALEYHVLVRINRVDNGRFDVFPYCLAELLPA